MTELPRTPASLARARVLLALALASGLASATLAVRAQDADAGQVALPEPGAPVAPSLPDPGAPIAPTPAPDVLPGPTSDDAGAATPPAPLPPFVPSAPGPDADAGPGALPSSADAGPGADGGQAEAGDGGAARPAAPELPLLTPDRAPTVSAAIAPRSLKTGALTKLTIRVRARADEEVTVPSGLRFDGPLEVRARRASTRTEGDRVVHTFEIDLQPMAPGHMELRPIDLRVVLGDGTLGRVQTGPLSIDVTSVLGNEPNAQPKPDAPPRSSPQPSWLPGWLLGSLLVVASVVLLTLLAARYLAGRAKPPPPPPPPRPPWEVALEKLGALQRSTLLGEGRVKEYVDGTTDALREYLGGRFAFDGLESTTDEILVRLKGRFGPSGSSQTLLSQIGLLLADGDLVKFAKVEPTPEHCMSMLVEAVRIVRTTSSAAVAEAAARAAAPPTADGAERDMEASPAPKEPVRAHDDAGTEPGAPHADVEVPRVDGAAREPVPASPDEPAPPEEGDAASPATPRALTHDTVAATAVAPPVAPASLHDDDDAGAAREPDDRRSGDDP